MENEKRYPNNNPQGSVIRSSDEKIPANFLNLNDDFNPLDTPLKIRDYSKDKKIDLSIKEKQDDLDEDSFYSPFDSTVKIRDYSKK